MGRVFRLGFVMSEEELLLGQVSLALLGLSNTSCVVFLRTGRSSDGPESGIAHHIWAGPHNFLLERHALEIYLPKLLIYSNSVFEIG